MRNGATIMVNGDEGDQGRRRLRQLGDDAGRRQVGHLPHAHASRHRHHPGRADRRGNRGRLGKGLHHRPRGRLRGDGADGGRLDSDGDGARLPRGSGVQHLRRRDRRREDHALHRGSGARRHLAVHEPGGQQPRKPRAARGRRRAQRDAGRRAREAGQGWPAEKPCSKVPAGFYHAYAGNNTGELTYSFTGDTHTSLDKLTARSRARTGCCSRRSTASTRFPATTSRTSTSRRSCAKSTTSSIRTSIASRPS